MIGANLLKLVISILITEGAGIVGAIFTTRALRTWYPALKKPSFDPPNSVFAPVWTTLFALIGISLFLVWRKGVDKPGVKPALTIFGVQLGLNVLWSLLFFGLKSPFYALIDIAFLWAAILATIIAFFPLSILASVLLIPYLLWVSFAAVLNYSIWQLNR